MKIRLLEIYDIGFDLMHLTVGGEFEYGQTVPINQAILVDFDINGKPVSFELVGASKHFKMLPKFFISQKRDGTIQVCEDCIIFRMNIHYMDSLRSFEKRIPNEHGISPGEYEFSNY